MHCTCFGEHPSYLYYTDHNCLKERREGSDIYILRSIYIYILEVYIYIYTRVKENEGTTISPLLDAGVVFDARRLLDGSRLLFGKFDVAEPVFPRGASCVLA